MKTLALLALMLLMPQAQAQAQTPVQAPTQTTVSLVGMLGGRALLIVDGAPPKSVATGDVYKGVKVISTDGDGAVLEIAGKRRSLQVGDAPASVGASADPAAGSKAVLTASSGGHFMAQGQINGKAVPMMVDTGASLVSLSVQEAQRLGIDYKAGTPAQVSTANGVIPVWRLKLSSVRVGDVLVYDVDSVVTSGSMPYVLLGNSFLAHFQMTRTNDQMVLEKRY